MPFLLTGYILISVPLPFKLPCLVRQALIMSNIHVLKKILLEKVFSIWYYSCLLNLTKTIICQTLLSQGSLFSWCHNYLTFLCIWLLAPQCWRQFPRVSRSPSWPGLAGFRWEDHDLIWVLRSLRCFPSSTVRTGSKYFLETEHP